MQIKVLVIDLLTGAEYIIELFVYFEKSDKSLNSKKDFERFIRAIKLRVHRNTYSTYS